MHGHGLNLEVGGGVVRGGKLPLLPFILSFFLPTPRPPFPNTFYFEKKKKVKAPPTMRVGLFFSGQAGTIHWEQKSCLSERLFGEGNNAARFGVESLPLWNGKEQKFTC